MWLALDMLVIHEKLKPSNTDYTCDVWNWLLADALQTLVGVEISIEAFNRLRPLHSS